MIAVHAGFSKVFDPVSGVAAAVQHGGGADAAKYLLVYGQQELAVRPRRNDSPGSMVGHTNNVRPGLDLRPGKCQGDRLQGRQAGVRPLRFELGRHQEFFHTHHVVRQRPWPHHFANDHQPVAGLLAHTASQ